MQVVVNGQAHQVAEGTVGAELLTLFKVSPHTIVIELNGEIMPRGEFLTRPLQEGDELELVTLVGGG